jgi:glyoxylase-like metal-dependent hydrolase (beta-lactamase superfamily II)
MNQPVTQISLNFWLNVFLLHGSEGVVLVDAGNKGQADLILERLAAHDVAPQDVRLILLTHGHIDHYGSAAELRERTGAPIALHTLEAEVLRSGHYPVENLKPTPFFALLMRLPGVRLSPEVPTLEPDITFEDEWRLDEYGVAGRVILTPGHSPGSVSVLMDSGEAIVGDMVMGRFTHLLRQPGRPFIAWNPERNQESIRQLVALSPRIVYASHGGPFEDISGLVKGS